MILVTSYEKIVSAYQVQQWVPLFMLGSIESFASYTSLSILFTH